VCLVERSSDIVSAIQGRPKIVAPMQGCPFGVVCSGWGFQGTVAVCHPGVRGSI
jgi:hypothetical protein